MDLNDLAVWDGLVATGLTIAAGAIIVVCMLKVMHWGLDEAKRRDDGARRREPTLSM